MRAVAFAGSCACLLAFGLPAAPAQAGGYGVDVQGPGYVWYRSSCCYRRVVRHERRVFYVRPGAFPSDEVVVYPRRPRIYREVVVPHRTVRFSEFDTYWNDGEFGVTGCYWNEAPVPIAPGAWAWGRRTTCY